MTQVARIDMSDITVTPVFKYLDLENVPQSEQKGFEVRRTLEVVEVHTAGSRNSAPVFPVDAMWKRDGNRTITYAERWPEAYRAFKEGGPQNAVGTPLEMLRPLGITPEIISLCRAHKIYSVEALNGLSHDGVKALGVHSNRLRDAARAFMSDRQTVTEATAEIAELRARLAALEAAPESALTDAELKDEIAKLNDGKRPVGNPSRATLEAMLAELQAAPEEQQAA